MQMPVLCMGKVCRNGLLLPVAEGNVSETGQQKEKGIMNHEFQ